MPKDELLNNLSRHEQHSKNRHFALYEKKLTVMWMWDIAMRTDSSQA